MLPEAALAEYWSLRSQNAPSMASSFLAMSTVGNESKNRVPGARIASAAASKREWYSVGALPCAWHAFLERRSHARPPDSGGRSTLGRCVCEATEAWQK